MMKRFLFFISVLAFCVPAFVANTNAAGTIPRTDLRLELLLATGSDDTSGNGRMASITGIAPTYKVDSMYGIPYTDFTGSGGLRVNTSWSALSSGDFTFSFWMKLPDANLVNNTSWNIANLTAGINYNLTSGGYVTSSRTYYDKPMVIFSSKTGYSDTSGLRLAISKEGTCSFNGDGRNTSGFNQGSPWNGVAYYNDFYTTQSSPFDCSSIKDGKWHNVVVTRKSGTLRMMVDNAQLWSGAYGSTIGKIITFGGMGFAPNPTSIYNVYQTGTVNDILSSSYYRGGMFGFREYSVALSDADIESLFNEFRYIQSNLVGTGSISISLDGYVSQKLTVDLNNLPLLLSKDLVQYEYAFSGGAFVSFPNIIDISSSTGSLNYQTQLDLSSVPDGQVTIFLQTRSGSVVQSIGNISFMKMENQPSITISAPNSDISTQKFISASASTGGILYYALTRGTTCDGTLGFDNYSDLTFTTLADNGVRVCYKAVYPSLNKTIYKLSAIIQGIQPADNVVASPTVKLFDNYTLWPKSSYAKPLDTASFILDLLAVSASASQGTINGVTMTDINGDGLVDFLYSRSDPVRRAIVINNGNYTFKTVYKCAMDTIAVRDINGNLTGTYTYLYYGDCADTTR